MCLFQKNKLVAVPFICIKVKKDIADKIAALNTDVFNSLDIKAIIYTATAAA